MSKKYIKNKKKEYTSGHFKSFIRECRANFNRSIKNFCEALLDI